MSAALATDLVFSTKFGNDIALPAIGRTGWAGSYIRDPLIPNDRLEVVWNHKAATPCWMTLPMYRAFIIEEKTGRRFEWQHHKEEKMNELRNKRRAKRYHSNLLARGDGGW